VNRSVTYTVALFVGLAIVVAAPLIAASPVIDALAPTILTPMGSTIFGSGLTIFLLRLLSTPDRA
jgi:hypothetical protein